MARRACGSTAGAPAAGIRQDACLLESGRSYDGSVWIKIESGAPRVSLRVLAADGSVLADLPLPTRGSAWQEVPFSFASARTDRDAAVEIAAAGRGAVLVDFVSLMRADVRTSGMLRPDLLAALRGLAPAFIRWPGGSFASTYKWQDGIGPLASRVYHPNEIWGGYSDYYGFGTDEYLELTRQLGADPMIVLPAPDDTPASVEYAMNWVHYVNDPPTTTWGQMRARNGHPEPYGVRYFQIDNEPMNNGFTPERYAAIVNLYGSRLRQIAPEAVIIACGQKRSNDMAWSEKVIDLAGNNFDVLGVHNYEYESDRFESGVRRIRDYLVKLRDYVRASAHPGIRLAVLEWNLSRTYDWRAGLHAAGSLILYESLDPELTMTAPALLMRNTTDDPTWTAFIYHDHVSWFPGGGYVVEKLFREHFAETYLASTSGTFRDIANRASFFSRHLPDEAGGLAARNGGCHRHGLGGRPAHRDQGRELQRQREHAARASAGLARSGGGHGHRVHDHRRPARRGIAREARSHQAGRAESRVPPRSDDRSATLYGRRHRDLGAIALFGTRPCSVAHMEMKGMMRRFACAVVLVLTAAFAPVVGRQQPAGAQGPAFVDITWMSISNACTGSAPFGVLTDGYISRIPQSAFFGGGGGLAQTRQADRIRCRGRQESTDGHRRPVAHRTPAERT